jgi:hypothetical protein
MSNEWLVRMAMKDFIGDPSVSLSLFFNLHMASVRIS